MKSIVALVACGLLAGAIDSNALGMKLGNQKTDQNSADTQNMGSGGVVKSVIDRLDQLESNSQTSNQLIDDATSGLKKIARNSEAEKELKTQIEALEKEAKKNKQDKKVTEEQKKDAETGFWTNPKNLTEAKKKGLSAQQRKEMLDFGLSLGVAGAGIAGQIEECKKLGEEIPKITPDKVKEEMKGNPMQAGKTISRLKSAPGTIASIQTAAVTQGKRIAVLSQAIKFLTAE
jgi:hypothetical protein